jgi:hypothetical protein
MTDQIEDTFFEDYLSFEKFPNSLYYIAPGFDFEPLWRMSHLCDTFFYANLRYTLDEVKNSIQTQLQDSSKVEIVSMEIDERFNEITHFDLHYQNETHLRQAFQLLHPHEKAEYNDIFIPEQFEDQWMITIKLRRKSTNRIITLYYFTGEGLACYVALSRNGEFAPRVLCTIQSGILEIPNGLMSRLLNSFEKKPLLWIRGFEETFERWQYSNAFNEDNLYNHIGLDFIHEWIVPASYLGFYEDAPSRRFCKGFITQQTLDENLLVPEVIVNNHIIHFNGIENIQWRNNNDHRSALFIFKNIYTHFENVLDKCDDVSFWEGSLHPSIRKDASKECIDFLRKIDSLNKYKEIHFIPFGMEDEGKLYQDFFNENHNAQFHMYLHRSMDFYDLKPCQ